MGNLFFVSYARDNDAFSANEFYNSLSAEIRQISPDWARESGYLDVDQDTGSWWRAKLVKALTTCRVFVPLPSEWYVRSEYCGRELELFLRRVDKASAGGDRLDVIVPVLWDEAARTERALRPYEIQGVQLYDNDFPPEYLEEGLRRLMQRDGGRREVPPKIIQILARRVVAACEQALPQWADPVDIDALPSAFSVGRNGSDASPLPAPRPVEADPAVVHVITTACDRTQAGGIERDDSRYGLSAEEWSPFQPEAPKRLAYYAQRVADDEGLMMKAMSATAGMAQFVKEAELRNEVVAVLVDGWAARIPEYGEVLREYDGLRYHNACTLIPWNRSSDEQTGREYSRLRADVHDVLYNTREQSVESYSDEIFSLAEFQQELRSLLIAAKSRVIRRGQVKRPPDDPKSPPRLTGPVGQ